MRAFLIAGEASGDRLGGALIDGLRDLAPGGVELQGIAGAEMLARGMPGLFPMEELSVMGIAEVLPRYPALRRRLHQTIRAVLAAKPDVLITIDSPDFCLRVARAVRAADPAIRIVHYVAPSVWAWRPGRARRMAPHVDQVLCLLPFEPPYMEAAGMRADFTGHPIAAEPLAPGSAIAAFRAAHGLGPSRYLLALPGSRRSEIARLATPFGETLREVLAAHPGLRVVLPTLPHLVGEMQALVRNWPGDPLIVAPDATTRRACYAGAEAALAASGTVSLELAAAATPMVIAYDMSWLSWQIMSRMALVDTVTLVNLVSETRAVPEFLGPRCRPELIAPALSALLESGRAAGAQQQAMEQTMRLLGRGQERPGHRAARAVLDGLGIAAADVKV